MSPSSVKREADFEAEVGKSSLFDIKKMKGLQINGKMGGKGEKGKLSYYRFIVVSNFKCEKIGLPRGIDL